MSRKFHSVRWLAILFAFVLLLFPHESLTAQSGSSRYYYYQGARVPLNVDPNLIAVRFNASTSRATQKSIADATGDVQDFDSSVESPVGGLVFIPLRAGRDPLAAASRLSANAGVQFVSLVYDFDTVQLAETDEFLARFPKNLLPADIARINQTNDIVLVRPLPYSDGVFVLKPNAGSVRSAREWANVYVETHLAEFAEPNFVLRETRPPAPSSIPAAAGELSPSDSNFGLQWSLKNTQQFQGSQQGADIDATRAWEVTRGAASIKVAVIDEGVYASHPELSGKVLPGYNAMNGTNNTTPKIGDHHGTGVAGVIAAHSNNGVGIAGVCWLCQILPVKVAETDSKGKWVTDTGKLASGIDWAWQNGADILNNSWTMNAPSDTVQLAIINARFSGRGGKGSTIVFAVGNENSNAVSFPGSLNSYVIAAGASNWCDQRKTTANTPCNNGLNSGVWGSNYGTALDLVAPGEEILTTCNGAQCTNGAYTFLSGTSLSAPLVSGAAALLYTLNPNLTPDQVQAALQNGARDVGPVGRDNETGYGRLDVYRALASMFNLKLKVRNSKKLVHPDDVVEYKFKYSNPGSAAMVGTQIFVPVPPNTTYMSSTPAFAQNSPNVYRLDLGTLPSNATGTAFFRIQILPGAAGNPIVLSASISGAFPESNSADNTASNTALGIRRDIFLPLIRNAAH